MRYFLDTEYDGFGGRLISLALVPEDGGEELYLVIDGDVTDPWVERHVMPFIDLVPDAMRGPRLARRAAAHALSHWLAGDAAPEITGPGEMMPVPPLTLRLQPLQGFSTAANSAVPHNALHDARALRDHVMNLLE